MKKKERRSKDSGGTSAYQVGIWFFVSFGGEAKTKSKQVHTFVSSSAEGISSMNRIIECQGCQGGSLIEELANPFPNCTLSCRYFDFGVFDLLQESCAIT